MNSNDNDREIEETEDKKEKLVSSIKNFFTKEVKGNEAKGNDKHKGSTKHYNEKGKEEEKEHESKKEEREHQTKEEIESDKRRQEVISKIKSNPINLLYILFALLIIIGIFTYYFKTSSFWILDIFIPFPLNLYGFLTFFIMLPIISCVLVYYKKYAYILLLYIINSGFAVRIQNLPLLKDITTGKYIPLALDPHLFLRYATYILEHGKLYATDVLRFSPYGADMSRETIFLSKFIVYLYKVLHLFSSNMTIELVDVLYPPICFVISLVFFFLIVKNLFNKKVALISTLILSTIPIYLYRTMSGFSDKESLGLMLMFIAFYFFIIGWKSKKAWKTVLLGLISGISTGLMGLTWGGVNFTLLIFAAFVLIEILLKKFTKNDFYLYFSWIIPMTLLMGFATAKFGIKGLLTSFTSGIAYLVFLISIIDFILFKLDLLKIKEKISKKLPQGITSALISIILAIIGASIIISPGFVIDKLKTVFSDMINPFGKTRWALTVAESHQPYFTNWINDFTWLYILLFFIGALILFYQALKSFSEKRQISYASLTYTIIYALFLMLFTMSRYRRENPVWNGETGLSRTVYIGSFIVFILVMAISYLYIFYFDKRSFNKVSLIDKKYIFIFVWFIIMLIAARSALRLMLMLAPITAILIAFFIAFCVSKLWKIIPKTKDSVYKGSLIVILCIVLIITFWPFASVINAVPVINKIPLINENGVIVRFASSTAGQAKFTGPSYDQQWQLTGKWIRENTPEDAIFTHWWDYGYWVQTGGQRTTVTDGGNWIGYWNHLMGRHALMAQDQIESLEFLNMHNATHFLVISDEVGKIGAYSSIGSDENYDRYTWISTLYLNQRLTKETRDGITFVYEGTTAVDEDFEFNGNKYYARQAAVKDLYLPTRTVEIEVNENQTRKDMQILQPYTILYQNNIPPVQIPIKCLYYQNQLIKFNEPGLDSCFMVIPSISNQGFDPNGAGLYLGHDATNAIWVNLFLFEQKNTDFPTDHFKLAFSQQHPVLESLNQQTGLQIDNVALYNGRLFGPLKIWEIDYPENLTEKPEYLLRGYGEANLTKVTVI